MAVKKAQKSIRDFWQFHRKVTIWTVIISQLIVIGSCMAILFIAGIIDDRSPLAWVTFVAAFGLGVAILLVSISSVTEPLYDILSALMHKTGEPTTTTPPNPNSRSGEKTGFKTVLQAIYSDASTDPTEQQVKIATQSPLSQALNHTSCGVVVYDADKKIISANAAAPIIQNQDGSSYLALDFLNEESILDWVDRCKDKSINAEQRWQRIGTDPRVVKKQRFFDVIASYERGVAAETVVFLIDQSDRYVPEEEDLNFIAFAAHELRGPITIIRGYLDILEQELSGRLKDDEPELLSRLTISANRLSSYINNILNVSRFDRHHLQVHLYEETISSIYGSIADDMQMRAAAQHRLLSTIIPDDLPTVAADRGSVSEVISNLIDNAIKYSFEGGVITVKAEAKGEFVEVSVADNGIGMPANVVSNLFHKFYRSHRSREAVAGTGIGLYICKAFVESHGGSISVRSKENEGSIFAFTLPIYATVKEKLLEDDTSNQSLIRHEGGWIKNHAMYRK